MKKTLSKKILAFAMLLVLITAAGCGATTPSPSAPALSQNPSSGKISNEPYTVSIFYSNRGVVPESNAPVLKEIQKSTGISFKLESNAGGNVAERLNLMLASKDYPDVVVMNRNNVWPWLEGNHTIDLLPLIKEYAPTYYDVHMLPENGYLLDMLKEEDGRLLFTMMGKDMLRSGEKLLDDPFDPNYEVPNAGVTPGLKFLYPVIEEVTDKKPETYADWYDAMKRYKELYPDKDHYGFSMRNDSAGEFATFVLFAAGYRKGGEGGFELLASKDGEEYIFGWKAPEMLEAAQFLNMCYREGLIDPEGPIQNNEMYETKLFSGKVFSAFVTYAQFAINTLGSNEATKDMTLLSLRLKAEGVTKQYQINTATIGTNATVITNNCKQPERIVSLWELLYTDDDFAVLNTWGIEGKQYILESDGKRGITPEMKAEYDAIGGINNFHAHYGTTVLSMVNLPLYTANGQETSSWSIFNTSAAGNYERRDAIVRQSKFNWRLDWAGTQFTDYTMLNIRFPFGSDLQQVYRTCATLSNDALANMVMAKDAADVERIYNNYISQINREGIERWEAAVQKIIDERKALMS